MTSIHSNHAQVEDVYEYPYTLRSESVHSSINKKSQVVAVITPAIRLALQVQICQNVGHISNK